MSDEQTTEPVAPEQPAAEAPENVAEAVADENVSATEPVPVLQQQPSSASEPQSEAEATKEPLSLEDAARALVFYVRLHRTIGDSDLAAAVADVEAALQA